ncbi:DUF1553 domain-containing protein [Botryobacter ruber]|uniref:DUF1553 domain-containing protein n=1 Tax=Botryobacter ruber TaxID=2171629 RepID=UPI000E0C5C13|nr:DUF1553 domain-containing protein [Botryobacter ruber]
MNRINLACLAAFCLCLWSCTEPDLPADVALAMEQVPEVLDYNIHVKPILSDRCYACHGPDKGKRKGDLRLDLQEGFDKKSDESGRKAIVAGSLARSEVYHRIVSSDPELVMPTPESHLTLTAVEKATLIKWIQDGADFKPHWSLVAPTKPTVPAVKEKAWVRNPVDHFVLAKLEEKGLKPNPEAGKETLIRRLSLDLTGLPPTLAEIDAFLADKSADAYEKVVDRLLRSPHYGERMAVDWLDVARYADTHGYQDDGYRNAYPWRDWVISAFNKNLPYDQFITWQLAGDLLPNPTKEQLIATCFLRNHPQSQEGGIVDEEYRVEYVADRVNVFGKAILAQSTECARCHDHKYDLLSQKEYFQLYAFFNNNNETGEVPYAGEASPSLILTNAETEKLLAYIHTQVAPLEQQAQDWQAYRSSFEKWLTQAAKAPQQQKLSEAGLLGYVSFNDTLPVIRPKKQAPVAKGKKGKAAPARKPVTGARAKQEEDPVPQVLTATRSTNLEGKAPVQVPGKSGKALKVEGDMGVTFNKVLDLDRHQPFAISVWVKTFKNNEKGPLFSKTGGDLNGWRGYHCELNEDQTLSIKLTHVYPANGIELRTTLKLATQQWHHLLLNYDGSSKAKGVKFYIDGKLVPVKVLNDNLQQSLLHARHKKNNSGVQRFMLGREFRGSVTDVAFDEFRAYKRALSELEVLQLAGQENLLQQLLQRPASDLSAMQKEKLFRYYVLAIDKDYAQLQHKLVKLRGQENDLLTDQEEVMIYQELPQPRATFLLDRGLYDLPTEQVRPSTPGYILPFDKNLPQNRLGLAQWLASEQQPLFARVAVNRFWQQCFGQGIVKTPDDFGNQGELPSHPELLDWLSVTFRESGWDVKRLLKTMVMSATYRQQSVPSPQHKAKDPDNKLFSRAPSYRLSAEIIRDNALAASGLLVRTIGGRSVHPYQPPGVWEALAVRNDMNYKQDHGDSLYRRSMYTIWKRSAPHPAMINFDAPDRYMCTIQRQKTSTPLQALVLLNDVQFVEAARVLAEHMVRTGGDSPEKQITHAFRSLTSRHPRKEELAILLKLYRQELATYKANPARAEKLLQEGEYPRDKRLPVATVATCAVVASTLMNFDEFIIKR